MISGGTFAQTIRPTYDLARDTSAYRQISLEIDRLDVTERQFLLLQNQMDSAIGGVNRLIGFGYKNMLEQKFQLVHTRDMAMPNLEYMTQSLEMSQEVVRNTMYEVVRNLYTGLYSTQRGYELAVDLFEVKEETYQSDQLRYESGMMSDLDFKNAEMDYLEAEIDLMEAEAAYEEMTINFNMMVGRDDLYQQYTLVDETIMTIGLGTVEEQVESALTKRQEILDIQNQIELKTTEKTVYESRGHSYLIFPSVELDYKKLNIELEKLALREDQTEELLTDEVHKSLNELQAQKNNIEVMTEMFDYQTANLEKFTLQHEMGYLSNQMYREIRNGILTFEMSYQLAIQNYNTQLFSHYHGINAGSSSEGGGF
jgi:hypothetical protein